MRDVGEQVVDRDLRAPDLRAVDPPGGGVDREPRAVEPDVGGEVGDRGPAGRVGERRSLHPDRERERPLLRVGERELREVALQHEPRIVRRARDQRLAQPVAHRRVEPGRQVPLQPARVCARELRLQVDDAGPGLRRAPGAARAAGEVGVRERDPVQRDLAVRPRETPAHGAGERIERDRGRVRLRQRHRHRPAAELRAAAALVRLDLRRSRRSLCRSPRRRPRRRSARPAVPPSDSGRRAASRAARSARGHRATPPASAGSRRAQRAARARSRSRWPGRCGRRRPRRRPPRRRSRSARSRRRFARRARDRRS